MDKRARSDLFRNRLQQAMVFSGDTQSSLARKTGADRSTLSQILAGTTARLPNGQLVGQCAQSLGVSADWLLGLSDQPGSLEQILAQALTMVDAPRALIDAQLFAWHQEAAGYKVRHVPAGLPDMVKIRPMLEWEYAPSLGHTIDLAISSAEDRLNWMYQAQSDYEIALPIHELQAFARAEGYYSGCPQQIRIEQLKHLAHLTAQLYPVMRVSLFDARKIYSAPITIFGPLRAVIYLGQKYLVFRVPDRIQALSQHFDGLIREAEIGTRDLPAVIDGLLQELGAVAD
ncbi:helix-turn-helix transcriptional regulator [uncultured Planktomarina sp.]|jgi:transcriptional regulator with XRE-family HTH domain|uniref:helix-turn-helix domain-containing protein n=1 Tax=uncultured Planktomarina sp. TaxID=1538529 RepID=UPI0032605DFA